MTKNCVVNTAESEAEHLGILLAAMSGNKHGIEDQEARGQQQLLQSEVLPADLGWKGEEAPYLALGFTFGENVPGDDLFRAATLPAGWKREGSSHAMWSYIVDERGFKRVGVFYKAAFYDRKAHMHLLRPGSDMATDALYGDGPITRASVRWDDLTESERTDFVATAARMRKDITDCRDIYGKYETRTAEVEALLITVSTPAGLPSREEAP